MGNTDKALYWVKKSIKEDNECPITNVFFVAKSYDEQGLLKKAFKYYYIAAKKESPVAIAEIIKRLELGIGISQNS